MTSNWIDPEKNRAAEAKAKGEKVADEAHDPDPASESPGSCASCGEPIIQNEKGDRICAVCLSYDMVDWR